MSGRGGSVGAADGVLGPAGFDLNAEIVHLRTQLADMTAARDHAEAEARAAAEALRLSHERREELCAELEELASELECARAELGER